MRNYIPFPLAISLWTGIFLAMDGTIPRSAMAEEPVPLEREIFVPFKDLDVLLENQPRRVLLSRQDYADLLKKAKKTPETHAPQPAVLVAADYTANGEEGRVLWTGNLTIDVLEEGLQTIHLDLSGVGLRRAMLDGKPASIGRSDDGRLLLFVEGKGRHALDLDMVSPLDANAAQQVLSFRVPQPPAAHLQLTIPGDVEVKGDERRQPRRGRIAAKDAFRAFAPAGRYGLGDDPQ